MAAVVVVTFVLLPLVVLLGDLVRPTKKDRPVAFAGPPSGKERPVPRSATFAEGVDTRAAAVAARDEARRSAVRAPIAAASRTIPDVIAAATAPPRLRSVNPVDAVHEAFAAPSDAHLLAGSVARRVDAA